MQSESTIKELYTHYIQLAQMGQYPLFFTDWLRPSLQEKQKTTFRKANHNVKHVFNQLARHKSLEKKKTALLGMDKLTREEFIRAFFTVVEHNLLRETNTLQ